MYIKKLKGLGGEDEIIEIFFLNLNLEKGRVPYVDNFKNKL